MLLFTRWWEKGRLAFKRRVDFFLFISILGIYLKLFLKYVSVKALFLQKDWAGAKAVQLPELPVLPGKTAQCRDRQAAMILYY